MPSRLRRLRAAFAAEGPQPKGGFAAATGQKLCKNLVSAFLTFHPGSPAVVLKQYYFQSALPAWVLIKPHCPLQQDIFPFIFRRK